CHYLNTHMDRGDRRLLAELAVTMAVQDGRLTVGENLILQFLADLLGISPRAFARLFQKIAHRPYPVAGDPSSPDWWRRREAGEEAPAAPENFDADRPGRAAGSAFGDDIADASPADEPMSR